MDIYVFVEEVKHVLAKGRETFDRNIRMYAQII